MEYQYEKSLRKLYEVAQEINSFISSSANRGEYLFFQ